MTDFSVTPLLEEKRLAKKESERTTRNKPESERERDGQRDSERGRETIVEAASTLVERR